MTEQLRLDQLAERVGAVPDFPAPGIVFRDITTLLRDPNAFRSTVDHLTALIDELREPDVVLAAIESRGFPFAAAVAQNLHLGQVLVRKPGKLPRETRSIEYQLEYGSDSLEVHVDDVAAGTPCIVVDDLLATGGTAVAAVKLLRDLGAVVEHAVFVIDLPELGGTDLLSDAAIESHSLISFDGH